ncbi:tetratricopeptide repeat protein [Roseovarius aestuariivivens]|uniref:tetratricopeptide repeat protein n=1 Tax=Roseovarius aestuariivivens TaxID=1888910 RepID=UPI001436B53D|nr:tetratricopeptide repeat protein [Roseovarius aestuariivivens]
MALTFDRRCFGFLLLSAALLLAGCQSSEERAQEHFESGLELLEQGDVSRALVEFRNVFRLDPTHKEARLLFARTMLEEGNEGQAYQQFLRLSEQYPNDLEARIELAELSIASQNWEEGERHGRKARELDPDNPRVQIISAALDYAQAIRDENPVAAADAASAARDLLDAHPDSLIAARVVIDQLMQIGDFEQALEQVNIALKQHPSNYGLHTVRLQLQANNQDAEALGASLREMVERFPDNPDVQSTLIRWYLEQRDLDGAEAFLRELADRPDAGVAENLTVVRFLMQVRDSEAARQELKRLIEAEEETLPYQALLATMDFEAGEQDKAIADLEALVNEGEESEARAGAKVLLAKMLVQKGNLVGARSRVEEILEEDPTNVQALKMRAAWLIGDDRPDEAIIDLRTALSQEPRDADIMTLMGQAHERAGQRDLAGERYALAVEASLQAPEESLRYAVFLLQEGREDAARAVLVEALGKSPNNIDLLQRLALLYKDEEDWNEVTRLIWRLRALETDRATAVANGLEADMMLRQERVDDTVQFLESLVAEDESGNAALAALVQAKVRAGQVDEVETLLDGRLAEDPDNSALKYMRAGIHMIQNERDEAAEIYASLLQEVPGNQQIMRTLHAIMVAEGQEEQAAAMVDEQIERADDPTAALLLKAERLERNRDFDGAIAIYEELYAQNSNNVLVANNLASLITTHRDTPEDLDRAYAIARRLSSSDFPPFQDTYGWIEYRRGNYEEALKYLEPAAEGMADRALVHYHLGMVYEALGRTADAKASLQRALDIAGDDPLPQYDRAREVLSGLTEQTE